MFLSSRTVDQTVHWLIHNVELPQYELGFRRHAVDGSKVKKTTLKMNHVIRAMYIEDSLYSIIIPLMFFKDLEKGTEII